METSNISDFQFESLVDPSVLTNPNDLAAQDSSFDDIYPFGILEGDLADAPQDDAMFNFDGIDFDQHAIQDVDGGFAIPTVPHPPFSDQRYVSLSPQSQTHLSSVWRPLEQPAQQFHYPDPNIFSHTTAGLTPYNPLQPLASTNPMTPQNFRAITPPGQQFSSIDSPLFLHGNMGPPAATVATPYYHPIPNYQDESSFNPEDMALSPIPEDLLATAIREGWAFPEDDSPLHAAFPIDLYLPNTGTDNHPSPSDLSDPARHRPSSTSTQPNKKHRRGAAKHSAPKTLLPNGEAKKGRPSVKPQTEERQRINKRRMEGYYRRKNDEGKLEKARLQSRESYWRRKQRRIQDGETVRSYGGVKRGRVCKRRA